MPLALFGNDKEGKIALDSLKKSGTNVDSIIIEPKSTNIMNIIIPNAKLEDNSIIHSWYDPITLNYTMNFSPNLPITLPQELQDKMLYIILDKFLPVNLTFIQNISADKKICLDIGHIRFFEHFTKQYLSQFLKLADFVQINDNVTELLFERLQVKNEIEFFEKFNFDLLISTKGKKRRYFRIQRKRHNKNFRFSPTNDCSSNRHIWRWRRLFLGYFTRICLCHRN